MRKMTQTSPPELRDFRTRHLSSEELLPSSPPKSPTANSINPSPQNRFADPSHLVTVSINYTHRSTMNYYNSKQSSLLATSPAAAAPSLFQQVGMAGSAAVITVSFVHPVDVVKVCAGVDVKRNREMRSVWTSLQSIDGYPCEQSILKMFV